MRRYKPKSERYAAQTAPPAGIQASDSRTTIARKLRRYQQANDTEQFDIVKDNLAQINFYLSEEAVSIAKGTSQLDIGKLVQVCTALGISYDKLYSKRDTGVKQLSFPEPLLGMVRKGLLLSKAPEVSGQGTEGVQVERAVARPAETVVTESPSIETPVVPSVPPVPQVRKKYRSSAMQTAHELAFPSIPATLPPLKIKGGGDGLGCDVSDRAGA